MAKQVNQPVSQEKFKTMIGGQALIEGILMQGPDKRAIVVRGPEGIVTKTESIRKKTGIAKWPLIRGVVGFGSSMVNGVKALMYSADFFPEMEEEPSAGQMAGEEARLGEDGKGRRLILGISGRAVFRGAVLPAAHVYRKPV